MHIIDCLILEVKNETHNLSELPIGYNIPSSNNILFMQFYHIIVIRYILIIVKYYDCKIGLKILLFLELYF